MKKAFPILVATVLAAGANGFAQSESMRPLLVRENRLPDLHRFELGSTYLFQEFDESANLKGVNWERQEHTIAPYVKFGALPNLTLFANFPYGLINSDLRDDTDGMRDVSAGLELLAYEYTYKYPYVIPYVEVFFPTGDEDEGLGTGDTDGIFGTAVGTIVADKYHYILDGRYDANIQNDGLFGLAGAFIWDLDDRFSMLGEVEVTEEPAGSSDGVPVYLNAGMTYMPTVHLSLSWYGGTSYNTGYTGEKGHAAAKIAYAF